MSTYLVRLIGLALLALLAGASPGLAQHYHGGGYGGYHGGGYGGYHEGHGGGGWVAPFVGGAILGGALGAYGAYGYAPAPYYAPNPYQPYYHWDCDPYGQCAWVWR
jgi:hypothetical protein